MKYALLLLCLLALPAAAATPPVASFAPPAKFNAIGGNVPSVHFQTIDGADMSLDPYLGRKILIVNLWATWCPPCVKEMPGLDRLAAQLPPDKFKVIVIAVQNEKAEVTGFFKRANIKTLTPYIDPQMQSARALNLRGLPSTLIIGPNGIIGRVDGELEWDSPGVVGWLKSLG